MVSASVALVLCRGQTCIDFFLAFHLTVYKKLQNQPVNKLYVSQ